MTDTGAVCVTGCGHPTKHGAVLCKSCADETSDALAALASWSRPMPSVFDLPAGRAMLGGAHALALELDVLTSRQTRRSDQVGPRPVPGSKVWAPNRRVDRAERHLTRTVQTWVAVLARGEVVAPHVVVTGHALARACTWLLWHAHDITTHPLAGDAHRDFTRAARDIATLVDRPPDRVYVGPCWHVTNDVECPADLYAQPGAADVTCPVCRWTIGVRERRAWLEAHYEEVELPAADVSRVLATIGLTVSRSLISVWATRDLLLARGRVNVGGHSRPTYRVGDVKGLAVREAQRRTIA